MDKMLLFLKSAPYGSAAAVEAFRLAIGGPSLDVETVVVLADDGVFCVLPEQDPQDIEMKSLGQAYANLPDFDARLVVLDESLQERNIDAGDIIAGEVITRKQLDQLIAETEAVIKF
ncbi:DsrE family protein [Metallumcola ferriviriculae]|uniref:DsrE family protein n=1 Tax=Metallumcola ferriviriculae TaxID=3039180 RepID=A0AAU0UTT7_9FIRM|nr:DsrE family protein [Desulfitibacteraceae bacterium MK1]